MTPEGGAALAAALSRLSALSAAEDVLAAALHAVVTLADAMVGGADGVSVSLRRCDRLTTVAASDRTVREMDHDQYETGEGPCVDASREGHGFRVESLDDEARWPSFGPRAYARGIRSIMSTPLLTPAGPAGALNLYSRTPRAFAEGDQVVCSLFAEQAAAVVVSARIDAPATQLAGGLRRGLEARSTIALAQGVLMEREGITAAEAYTELRRFSQRTGMPLLRRAAGILATTSRGGEPRPPGG